METPESLLLRRFSSTHRRIWINYSKLNTFQAILFPINQIERYKIVTKEKVQELWITDPETKRRVMNIDLMEKIIRENI